MIPFLLFFFFTFPWLSTSSELDDLLQCLSSESFNIPSTIIYTQNDSSYSYILQKSLINQRFNTAATPKPQIIVTPKDPSQIQSTVSCAKQHGMEIRVRSGGHDYEGISYVAYVVPFILLDLMNFRNVTVDLPTKTAWVQSGAILGDLYCAIAEKRLTLGFPAGVCPSVGVGGHFSGGAYGILIRKYGLAVDHVVDAILVDARGRLLDRASMGEDLFWAIRGGGGNTFGIVISWKVNLVELPPIVTVFNINRTLEQNLTDIVHRWQYVAPKLPDDVFMRIFFEVPSGELTLSALITCFFLGRANALVSLLNERLPELGLVKEDCIETTWIGSCVYFAGSEYDTVASLTNRSIAMDYGAFKGTSDYVKKPMSKTALEGLWSRFPGQHRMQALRQLQFTAYGGKMARISDSSVPFPHRAGYLFQIHYLVDWENQNDPEAQNYMNWVRELRSYMTPYVSKSPRAAYVNYRDLDNGMDNLVGNTSYAQASIWGREYFGKNFDRLVHVKTAVDPDNFFRNEQSVPPLTSLVIEQKVGMMGEDSAR